ncbi:MAG TPA: hypothetical protein VMF51_07630 [Nocardioides sp.]|uniref:hypothetical protein n=1 Tax=Nocardioides sp. TaxID=35761 RepID=UPI002B7EF9A5|nr:hypothetical protein [Nocardioides sp.]HTW14983.1 hypothetical protein [Nocardioides sp.]
MTEKTLPEAITITVATSVDHETAARYYQLYRDTFSELATRAVARQLLHEEEFMEEMDDERVMKYLAWSAEGELIGMSTLTRDLSTVPWISPDYFAHHYPEHTARNAVFYLGFTLVERRRRQAQVFQAMISTIVELLVEERAVCGYDLCAFNDKIVGLGPSIERLLHRNAGLTLTEVDLQTYYSAVFDGTVPPAPPAPAEAP